MFVYLFVYTRRKNFNNRTTPQPPHEGALSLFSLLFFCVFFRKWEQRDPVKASFCLRHRLSMSYPRARVLCEKKVL